MFKIKPVVVNVKSSKPKPEVVEIRKSMTVLELASLLDRTHGALILLNKDIYLIVIGRCIAAITLYKVYHNNYYCTIKMN